jgi:hypothetical protein
MHAAWSLVVAVSLGVASFAVAANAEEIALKECWGLDMANMQDVRKLDPRKDTSKSLPAEISRTLMRAEKDAGPCFAVNGVEKVALVNAARILVNDIESRPVISSELVTLVFYSHPAPGYVSLDSIDRDAQRITIKYKIEIHAEAIVTAHFALIPLGKLTPGKYKVDIVHVGEGRYDRKKAESAVCDSGSFTVRGGFRK